MRIISTFDDRLYESTGRNMLKTLKEYIPKADVTIYEELESNNLAEDIDTVSVRDIPQFDEVFKANKDIITPKFGGLGAKKKAFTFYNSRWFGWFRKVLAQYHAVCVADYEGYIIFVDSDIRFTKAFDESFLDATTKKKAISYFKGTRLAAETGFVVINNNKPESKTFFDLYLKFFISGEFRKLERWDDGFVFDYLIPFNPPEWFHDFAEGNDPIEHVNSNGHEAGGQIMVTTEWGKYFEHDKGYHWRGKSLKNLR